MENFLYKWKLLLRHEVFYNVKETQMKGTVSGTALQVVWQGQQYFTLRKVHQHLYTLLSALARELYRNAAHQG